MSKINRIETLPYLVNLIHNAIKFTHEGFVEFGYIQASEDELLFHVKDTGSGIPEELKSTIFERFRKLENSRQKLYGGAGLGLAITRQLVSLLGGKIWLESYEGKGTTFYFTLPFVTTEIKEKKNSKSVREIELEDWSDKTILIVEDDIYSYELISEYLSKTGIGILKSGNGTDALEILKRDNDIDLVIMDIQLPEMSGYELVHKLRKKQISIPVIAQTAYAMEEDRKMALNAGCDDFISKPVDRSTLLRLIHKHLDLVSE
jgi:CheY-like chemotaxis protein